MNKPAIGLINYQASASGGIQKVLTTMAEMLADQYEVHIISITTNQPYPDQLPIDAVYHTLLPNHPRLRQTIIPAAKALRKYIKTAKLTALLVLGDWSGFAVWLAHGSLPVVICDHGTLSVPRHSRYTELETKFEYRYFSRIVVLTDRAAQLLAKKDQKYLKRAVIIPNAITVPDDQPIYHPALRTIVTLTRMSGEKGLDQLVETARLLKEKCPDFVWNVYGDGELRQEFIEQLKKAGVADNVRLMGYTNCPQQAYRQNGILALTSPNEGFSMVLLEAKAVGLPLVSFDIDCSPADLIRDGVDGFLIPKGDCAGMADALFTLISDDKVYRQCVDASRDNIGPFTKSAVSLQWHQFIATLIRNKENNQ